MFPARGITPIVLLAGSLAAAAACGSPASSASSGTQASTATATTAPSKLTGASANALVNKAITNTGSATSVRVTGQGASGGKQVTFDITMVRGKGCAGTLATSRTQTFQIVQTGGWTWLKPTREFYQSMHLDAATIAKLSGKYIKVKSTDRQLSDLTKLCSLTGLFGGMNLSVGKTFTATPASYAGQAAYHIAEPGNSGYGYVSGGATPLLLKLAANGATIQFSAYNTVSSVTPPPAAQTIDGSQLGL